MVQVTQAAAAEIAEARRARGLPDSVGIRLYGQPQSGGELALGLAFVEVPAEDDQVTEQAGAKVFVAAEVVDVLSEVALDVQPTPEGPQLVLTPAG